MWFCALSRSREQEMSQNLFGSFAPSTATSAFKKSIEIEFFPLSHTGICDFKLSTREQGISENKLVSGASSLDPHYDPHYCLLKLSREM